MRILVTQAKGRLGAKALDSVGVDTNVHIKPHENDFFIPLFLYIRLTETSKPELAIT